MNKETKILKWLNDNGLYIARYEYKGIGEGVELEEVWESDLKEVVKALIKEVEE